MKYFWAGFVVLIIIAGSVCAMPENLKQIWDIPTGEVKAWAIKKYHLGKIKVEEVYYTSRPYNRQPVKIFGYYCYPSSASKLPAILLSHGGGGNASLARAADWAKRGYAVLSIDLPGKGENRSRSHSTGPDMIVKNLLLTQPDPSHNYLVHAVAAARNGITYLTQRKEVDPKRIGMIGLSWGGVLTLLTNGQDQRLKAAVNIFGAGYIPEGCTWEDWFKAMPALDKEIWQSSLDPQNFLASQHAPIYFITGTNDHCYYLPIFQKSFLEIKNDKDFLLIPNLRHRFYGSAQIPALLWLDSQLKKKFRPVEVSLLSITPEAQGVRLTVKTAGAVRAKLNYTGGGPSQWTEKTWRDLKPRSAQAGLFTFSIPATLISPEVLFYITAKNQHGLAVSTLLRSLFSVRLKDGSKTYALSSPITRTYRHDKPITLLNGLATEKAFFSLTKGDGVYRMFLPD